MNYSPITFNTSPNKYLNSMHPEDYELIKNHNYVMYLDASNYYKCKKTGEIYRISFRFNNIYSGPHQLKM